MFRTAASRAIRGRRFQSTSATAHNLETRWPSMSPSEQNALVKQLEKAQQGDWKLLSADDKKAAYYIAFGPHGPRRPLTEPGHTSKVIGGVAAVLGVSTALFVAIRAKAQETPVTLTKEWEEATNEYLKSQKSNPISGISSEGYKGKGYVTH